MKLHSMYLLKPSLTHQLHLQGCHVSVHARFFFKDRVSLARLELFEDQTGLRLTEIFLPLLLSAGTKIMCHHTHIFFFLNAE